VDGTSNTLLVGEKWLRPRLYAGGDWHDDRGYSDGWDPDTVRTTGFKLINDSESSPYGWEGYQFGSAHTGFVMFVLADGAVRQISITIDNGLFNNLGHRADGKTITEW
jgi:hypothetical protein